MNPTLIAAVLGGGMLGMAIYLAVVAALPERVALADSLNNTSARRPVIDDVPSGTRISRLGPLQVALETRLARTRLASPDTDLALIEWSRGRYLLTRLGWVAIGTLTGPLLTALWSIMGAGVPPAIPLVAGLAVALVGWVMVGLMVRDKAAERRLEMREALVAYLTLVALDMAGSSGRTEAMQSAAAASTDWTFRRLDARIAASVRAGSAPESGLKALATHLGVEELSDVAEILNSAGTHGAQVFTTLLARADGLRSQLRTDAEAAEAARSTRARIPAALFVAMGLAFILYPLISNIAG